MQIEEGVIHRGWRPHLLVDFQTFSLFIDTVSGYKQMFYLADTPQEVYNIHRATCFHNSCIFPLI